MSGAERGLGAGIPDASERGWQDLGLGFGACWVLRLGPFAKDPGSWGRGSSEKTGDSRW